MYLDIALVIIECIIIGVVLGLLKGFYEDVSENIKLYRRYKKEGYQLGYPTDKEALKRIQDATTSLFLFLLFLSVPFFIVLHFLIT